MKKLIVSAAVAATLVAAPAFAQELTKPDVYGSIGYTRFDSNSVETPAVTLRGGARVHKYFGVEAEASMGMDEDQTGPATYAGIDNQLAVYGVGFLPVSEKLDLIARVGVSKTELVNITLDSEIDEDWGVNFGVGAQYLITESLGVRGEWTRTEFNDDDQKRANAFGVSVFTKF